MRQFATLVVLLALAGCNTVAGVGQDITGASHWAQGNIGGGGGY
ncbi:hypothetical protein RM190_07365 [Paracoccus sp. CPCC 101403]|uniref:Entericidin EcnA/B family protein n=2 Tax=Paracoccus broussonetiae TaxID=3075834 RepID=A0ABU3EBS0_9RHOB|nr:hypothetical protein [Paracoccus sp. CPCC 101403]MDT1061673.1 hypothetical protein [Paracoccus sp. CPCC 101403]